MEVEDVLNYVMNTPGNTNPNVLKPMLDELEGDKLPPVTEDDKGKYLHLNESTGAKEWATAGGGSSGGGVLVVHEVEEYGDTLLSGILPNVSGYAWRAEVRPVHNVYYVDVAAELGDANIDDVYVLIGDMRFYNDDMMRLSYSNGVLSIMVGWTGQVPGGYDIVTSESDIIGKNITVYANLVTRLDKTYKEITDAGFAVLHLDANGHGTYVNTLSVFGNPETSVFIVGFGQEYIADNPNDYPMRQHP